MFIISTRTNAEPIIDIVSESLWEVVNPINRNYTITDPEGTRLSIIEKINDNVIRTLENQQSGSTQTLDLTDIWSGLEYGRHKITIEIKDEDNAKSMVTIKFIKPKILTNILDEYSELNKLSLHIESIKKDIEYQSLDLSQTLKEKGILIENNYTLYDSIKKVRELPSAAMYEEVKLNSEKIKELEDINAENVNKISILEGEQEIQNEEILSNMLATTEVFEMILTMSAPMSVDIENKNKNLVGNSMVEVYVTLILKGVKTIDQVPAIIRDQVKEQLDLLTK